MYYLRIIILPYQDNGYPDKLPLLSFKDKHTLQNLVHDLSNVVEPYDHQSLDRNNVFVFVYPENKIPYVLNHLNIISKGKVYQDYIEEGNYEEIVEQTSMS